MKVTRRQVLKYGLAGGAGLVLPWKFRLSKAHGAPMIPGLSDPALQPKFVNPVPDALAPSFKYYSPNGKFKVAVGPSMQMTGLMSGSIPVPTPVWGYGLNGKGFTWPGRTFEVQSGQPIEVKWENKLLDAAGNPLPHLITSLNGQSVVDTSLHWAYGLPGYEGYSIDANGVPVVAHLHGGHTDFQYDGNPEFYFSPGWAVRGPQWMEKKYTYLNDQPAGNLWYHDHALGITRLNVYAGLAGFYFVRDAVDTGTADNPLGLPAWPYEKAYAIQDRMFKENGELFYPAFPGDPFYEDFITDEGAYLPPDIFPDGGPAALAEFFGDHMVVNGMIWPREDVERRHYRLHLLNGTDSRFMVVRFRPVPMGDMDLANAGAPLPFQVIGSDQGLAAAATEMHMLLCEPGARYDVVFDFAQVPMGTRIIMENIGGDAPFGGDFGGALAPEDFFPNRQTDRIMSFDVVLPLNPAVPDLFEPAAIGHYGGNPNSENRIRKVALFEGNDEFGRLQPLLGTAEPAYDYDYNPVINPDTGLPFEGAIAWHSPTTENPALGDTEIWEIYNATGDAHPVHLHLVNFEILDRQEFTADVIEQPVKQHNGDFGVGFRLENIELGAVVPQPEGYVENAPKDMVTALPGQVTRIKATFDKPGRYVWHCHILSHEDHEMMRVLHVGPGA
jgi:spore coat protein A